MSIIISESLSKTYSPGSKTRAVAALADFSLTVNRGEIFGLLGPNGAGKTTFIKLLLSIVFPSGGSARLLGEPIGSVAVKSRVGYLPENHKYPPYLTGAQILRFFGRLGGLDGARIEKRITETLALVDMSQWRNMKVKKYSKGMMQRIGLAQALMNDPDLLILDEPTDGVDPQGRKEIRDILVRLQSEGKTIFLNSHLLSEVEQISSRVAILNKGRLVRSGTVRELTESEHVYLVAIEGALPDTLRMEWEATRVPASFNEGVITLSVDDLAALNAVIDRLRAAGVLIRSVARKRNSLEDVFIQVVSQEAA